MSSAKKYVLVRVVILLAGLMTSTNIYSAGKANALSMSVYNKLTTIERLMAEPAYEKAQKKLTKLLNNMPDRVADRAYIYHSRGTLALYQEDYQSAKKYFSLSYQQNALDVTTEASVLQTLANLAMHGEKYQQAIDYLQAYLKISEAPTKQVYIALGTAYYQVGEYAKAITPLQQAMKQFEPDKSAHLMLFSAYYELKQLSKATDILERMIKLWPQEGQYWVQLASIYLEQKKYDKSLEIMQLALTKGYLKKESELLQYVYTLFEKGLPYKAAIVLADALQHKVAKKTYKNYSLLASLYVDAREEEAALDAFKTTSQYSTDGKEDLYIAQIYYDREKFKQSIKHAKVALDKGVKQPGNTCMLLAAAYNDLENSKKSREYLLKASAYKNTRKTAKQWLELLSAKE